MRARALPLVVAAAILQGPVTAAAQSARIGAAPEPGVVVVGRVCVDLDRDGACGEGEPGVSGALLRFEDGRRAVADEGGRFHAFDLGARILLGDRSAYGAHAVSLVGAGIVRRFELSTRGAAAVDLPVPPPGGDSLGGVESRPGAAPRLDGGRVLWPVAGKAPPGAVVRVGGAPVAVGRDGTWAGVAPLDDGRGSIAVTIATRDGAVEVWGQELLVIRPASGAIRVHPSAPSRLASILVRPSAEGALLLGRIAPGVELRIGASPVRGAGGWFGAWQAGDGPVRVAVLSGGATATVDVDRGTIDRSFDGLVLGELELQLGGSAGFLASGRLAASGSGRWRGFELAAGVDLDDRDRDAASLASPRDSLTARTVLDPLRGFVSAGDQGALHDANPGRGRAWADVEGHGLRLRLGSARTGLLSQELGRHDRAFFGARIDGGVEIGGGHVDALAWGGSVGVDASGLNPPLAAQDVFLATGGSLQYLAHRQIVTGSEAVRVEWRDPISRLTVARRELVRGRDYELDHVGGVLLLARPLPTWMPGGALLGGDPFTAAEGWLVVDYLHASSSGEGGRAGAAGGEVRASAGPVALSVGGAAEDRAGPDWGLVRGAASLDLGRALKARVEVARSDGRLHVEGERSTSLDGGFTKGEPAVGPGAEALAVHASAEGAVGPARWQGWWRERQRGYSDDAFTEPSAARERGAIGRGAAGPVALKLGWVDRRGADPLDPTGASRRDAGRGDASAAIEVGPVELALEAVHERTRLPDEGTQTSGGVRAAWRLGGGLTLEGSHLESIATSGQVVSSTFTSAGASLRTPEGTISLRAGWGPELGPRLLVSGEQGGARDGLYGTLAVEPGPLVAREPSGSAVGGRQRVEGATLFTEERLVRDAFGAVAGRVVGATLEPLSGLALTLSGERGERRRLDGSTVARGAGGASVAWARGVLRLDGRAERREEGAQAQWLVGGGAEWIAGPRLSLAARALVADGEQAGLRARGEQGWLTAAWRADALSILGRLGRVLDDRQGITDRDATVVGIVLTARPVRRIAVGIGADAAHQRVAGASDDRLAGSARVSWTVAGPVDVAAEYARRGSLSGRALGDLDAARLEAGVTASGVRVALGWAIVGFRGDGVDPEEERDGRLTLRAVVAR